MNKPSRTLFTSINSIESGNYCYVREVYPVKELLPISVGNSLLTYRVQPIEAINPNVARNLYQGVAPLEGVCFSDFRTNKLFNQCNRNKSIVNYPLEGVKIPAQNFSQSASNWFSSLDVTFPA